MLWGSAKWRRALDDFHKAGMRPERAILAAGGASLIAIGAGWLAVRASRRRLVKKRRGSIT